MKIVEFLQARTPAEVESIPVGALLMGKIDGHEVISDGSILLKTQYASYFASVSEMPQKLKEPTGTWVSKLLTGPKVVRALTFYETLGEVSYFLTADIPGEVQYIVPLARKYAGIFMINEMEVQPCISLPYDPTEPVYIFLPDWESDPMGEKGEWAGLLMPMDFESCQKPLSAKLSKVQEVKRLMDSQLSAIKQEVQV